MVLCLPWLVRTITGNFARAITLYPFVLLRYPNDHNDPVLLNHERIHLRQQLELLVVPFYVWYLAEYAWHRFRGLDHLAAYLRISFEREAYANEQRLDYLGTRRPFAFRKYA
jgi:hypothetical protein